MFLTPTRLLSSENCPQHLTNFLTSPWPSPPSTSQFPAKLSHLAEDLDSGQGLEEEGMQTFFKNNELGRVLGCPFLSGIVW